jgi:hypothetical protein
LVIIQIINNSKYYVIINNYFILALETNPVLEVETNITALEPNAEIIPEGIDTIQMQMDDIDSNSLPEELIGKYIYSILIL